MFSGALPDLVILVSSPEAWIVQSSPLRNGPFASWGIPRFLAAEGSSILYAHLVVMFAVVPQVAEQGAGMVVMWSDTDFASQGVGGLGDQRQEGYSCLVRTV